MFSFLSSSSVESIHSATLRILNETGIVINHAGARDMLTANGARIEKNRVLIPPELVEKCIASAGKKVSVRGRGGVTKHLGDGNL